jgi:hypothetical protein
MIDPRHLRIHVIEPALEALGLYSKAAEELILGTICQESQCGRYLVQLGNGPAIGICQMEPRTFWDIEDNFIKHRSGLREKINRVCKDFMPDEMAWNLRLSVAMCRIHYYRRPEPLPPVGNIRAQADYWKQHYNTRLGAGTVQEYLENWRKYAAG